MPRQMPGVVELEGSGQRPEAEVTTIEVDPEESRLMAEAKRREIGQVRAELNSMRALSLRLSERKQARCVTIAATGEVRNCSQAFANLLKLSPQDLLGVSLLDFLSEPDRNQFLSHCRACISAQKEVSFVARLARFRFPTLKVRWIMTRLAPGSNAEDADASELLLMVTDAALEDSLASAEPRWVDQTGVRVVPSAS